MSSYYSEPPPRIDLMLQDIIFSANGNQNTEQNGLTKSKGVSSPSGSSESKKTVTFEGDGIFNLNDISITVPKVIISQSCVALILSNFTNYTLYFRDT